jgi:hypothetical protein
VADIREGCGGPWPTLKKKKKIYTIGIYYSTLEEKKI